MHSLYKRPASVRSNRLDHLVSDSHKFLDQHFAVPPFRSVALPLLAAHLEAFSHEIDRQSHKFLSMFYSLIKSTPASKLSMLHNYPILKFLENYFGCLRSVLSGSISDENKLQHQFHVGCRCLALLLKRKVFTPTDICQTEILEFLAPLLDCTLPLIEEGLAFIYSSCLTECDCPEIVLETFFGVACSCRTSFQTLRAQKACLRFFQRVFQYIDALDDEIISRVNECLVDLLEDSKNSKIYPQILTTVRAELFYRPDAWRLCERLFDVANLLLRSAEDAVLVQVFKLFSLMVITETIPLEDVAGEICYDPILLNFGSVVPDVSSGALSLAVDLTARSAVFVESMIANGLFEAVANDRERPMREKITMLWISQNICLVGEAAHVMGLLHQPFFAEQLDALETLNEEGLIAFLEAMKAGLGRTEREAIDVQKIFEQKELRQPLIELGESESERIVAAANEILEMLRRPE
jgi:hypothetical protein